MLVNNLLLPLLSFFEVASSSVLPRDVGKLVTGDNDVFFKLTTVVTDQKMSLSFFERPKLPGSFLTRCSFARRAEGKWLYCEDNSMVVKFKRIGRLTMELSIRYIDKIGKIWYLDTNYPMVDIPGKLGQETLLNTEELHFKGATPQVVADFRQVHSTIEPSQMIISISRLEVRADSIYFRVQPLNSQFQAEISFGNLNRLVEEYENEGFTFMLMRFEETTTYKYYLFIVYAAIKQPHGPYYGQFYSRTTWTFQKGKTGVVIDSKALLLAFEGRNGEIKGIFRHAFEIAHPTIQADGGFFKR